MCRICYDLANDFMKPYDASIMASEIRNQIGEEHYAEIQQLIKAKEKAKLIDEFEMDFGQGGN